MKYVCNVFTLEAGPSIHSLLGYKVKYNEAIAGECK